MHIALWKICKLALFMIRFLSLLSELKRSLRISKSSRSVICFFVQLFAFVLYVITYFFSGLLLKAV